MPNFSLVSSNTPPSIAIVSCSYDRNAFGLLFLYDFSYILIKIEFLCIYIFFHFFFIKKSTAFWEYWVVVI